MNWTPWRRNQEDNVPTEVKDYYQSERRERVGVAWLLAIGTLLATLAIVIALFFGGRWAWRALFGNDDTKAPTSTGQRGGQKSDDPKNGANPTPAPPSSPSPSPGSPSTGTSSTSTSTPSGSTPTAPAVNPPVPVTPGLTNTGPGDETGM